MEQIEIELLNHPQPLHTVLLENLRSNQKFFENSVRQAVADGDIDVNFVHPDPTNKTLLEVTCCEGLVESAELLLELGADVNRLNYLHNRAPIHFAAEAGHADVLQVLLEDVRCNPDLEIEKQTALQFAVANDFTDCVRVLLSYGVNSNIANPEGLTPIYIAATKSNREVVELILETSTFPLILNDVHDLQDGSTLTTRQILQKEFPDLELPTEWENTIDVEKRSSWLENESDFLDHIRSVDVYRRNMFEVLLGLAAARNFPNGIRELLKTKRRDDALRNIDKAFDCAIVFGNHSALKELLTIDSKFGNKLLLEACQLLRIPAKHPDDRIECFRLIVNQPNINVRCEDTHGNTPLHFAAQAESIEAMCCLLKLGSSLDHRNGLGVPPLGYMSNCAVSDIFDNCIRTVRDKTITVEDIHKKRIYDIEFDYRYLIPYIAPSQQADEVNKEFRTSDENISALLEMRTLAYIANNPTLNPSLKHPVLSSFLDLKWHRIRHFLYAYLVFYVIFWVLINCYILSTNYKINSSPLSPPNSSNLTSTIFHTHSQQLNGFGALTAVFLVLLAVLRIIQIIHSRGHYFCSLENDSELVLIFLGIWTLVAPNPQIGAVVILLSAWELLMLMGQYPVMSTGINMLNIVTKTFLKCLFLYAILILAFAFAFSMLFCNTKDNENFLNTFHWLFKTIIMITGEFDTNALPFASHPVLSRCVFILFVFFIAIVMLNLLNGLAVSDTARILNKSEIVSLISRVKLVRYFERLVEGLARMKISGRCCSKRAVCRLMFKLPEFLAMKTRILPKYLPEGKITIRPYAFNMIIEHGTSQTSLDRKMCCGGYFESLLPPSFRDLYERCTDYSMDPLIVDRAREILVRRESQSKASMSAELENRRINAQFDTVNAKLDRLETAIYKSGFGNVRKSSPKKRFGNINLTPTITENWFESVQAHLNRLHRC